MAIRKITFSAANCVPSTQNLWYNTATGLYYGDSAAVYPVDKVPMPTRDGYVVTGFYQNLTSTDAAKYVEADGTIIPALAEYLTQDRTVYAKQYKAKAFGDVTAWFGLASDWLIPESSTSGDELHRVDPSNGGKLDNNVNAVGITWRNPSVTYRVVADGRLSVSLGQGFIGHVTDADPVSGYMIVGASVRTVLGEFPTVTVTGTANEGANYATTTPTNAITHAINIFSFAVDIQARARAQNLIGALSIDDDVNLHEMTLTAGCTPVVLEENGHPCASDIVDGVLTASARMTCYGRDFAARGANGFAALAPSDSMGGTEYRTVTQTFRKAMV